MRSDPIGSSIGITQYLHPKDEEEEKLAKGYTVVHHGPDPEIMAADKALTDAEGIVGHKLVMGTKESKAQWHNVSKDTPYNFHPELDEDIAFTAKGAGFTAEELKKHLNGGAKVDSVALQLDAESDPIGASIGIVQYLHPKEDEHPIDYPVVDHGPDPDIMGADKALAAAEKIVGSKLTMGTAESKA